MRAGLRLLEEHEMKIQRLRDEVQKGFDSGIAKDFDFATFLQEKTTNLSRRMPNSYQLSNQALER